MRIGITYDLRSEYLAEGYDELATAEFDRPDTIEAIECALLELGHSVDRIGRGRSLVQRLAAGDRWDMVFNICEGMFGFGREAQVPAILDLYQIPYTFADPLVMSVCLHKQMTRSIVKLAGVPIAEGCLIERIDQLDNLAMSFPLFAKPVAQGTSKGVTPQSKIHTSAELRATCKRLLNEFTEPVLVETYLSGREFTVGILGTGEQSGVLGTLEIVMRSGADDDVYSFRNKEYCEELVEYRFVNALNDWEVQRAEALALQAWRALGCRDAGRIDLRSDSHGQPVFIEANPLAGLHPTHSDLPMLATALGISYSELVSRIVASAAQRVASQ